MTTSEAFYQVGATTMPFVRVRADGRKSALKLLRSRRRGQRPDAQYVPGAPPSLVDSTVHISTKRGKGQPSCDGVRAWLNQIGHSDATIDSLRIIHVAGSKGKGSTCAFAEALLRAHGKRTSFPSRYGLYTSPSLYEEVERIRINSENVSKQKFAQTLFDVWDMLVLKNQTSESQPRFLQLCLLVAIHLFIKEGVEVVILETHYGGQYDSTNIFPHPAATGVTSLGFDHVTQLGPTIAEIARHKAGIFKTGSPAFALAKQPADAYPVLVTHADRMGVRLQFVEDDPQLPSQHLVIAPEVQRSNCSLAKALVSSYLEQDAPTELRELNEEDISKSLDHVHLPGRFQHLNRGQVQWYLDVAHNAMSIDCPIAWFSRKVTDSSMTRSEFIHEQSRPKQTNQTILAFSQISTQRDGQELLEALIKSTLRHGVSFDHVIFCYDGTREDGSLKQDLKSGGFYFQHHYAEIWQASQVSGHVTNTFTIDETIDFINELSSGVGTVDVLVTGDFHLVGAVLGREGRVAARD